MAGLAILGLAILLMNVLKNSGQEKLEKKPRLAQAVEVLTVSNTTVPLFIEVDGPLRAKNKIQLFAEVNGILQVGQKAFEEGVRYQQGEVILALESSEAKSAYLAAKNQYITTLTQALPDIKLDYPEEFKPWQDYLSQITSSRSIDAPPVPENTKLRLFLTSRGVYSNYENLNSSRIRLSKYQITAPFNGVLTEALVQEGSLVRAGQALGEFIEPNQFEMIATVRSQEIAKIEVGQKVQLRSPDTQGQWTGTVYRTNAKVDPNSLRVQVFIAVSGQELRDGMYLSGKVRSKAIDNAYRIPRKLIFDQNSLYVVQDSVLQEQAVEVIHSSPQWLVVKGLEDGTQIPANTVPGAYPGMPVKTVNK